MSSERPLRLGWIAALVILAVGYRVLAAGKEGLWNTAPLMALSFGGGMLLERKFWWIPAATLMASDLALGLGSYTLFNAVFYSLAALAGYFLSRNGNRGWLKMWLGTLTCSVIFYVAANTFAWAGGIGYAKTLAGWWQSQTTGLPGFPPSILFLRNALIGDTVWCLVAAPLFFWQALILPEKEPVLSR